MVVGLVEFGLVGSGLVGLGLLGFGLLGFGLLGSGLFGFGLLGSGLLGFGLFGSGLLEFGLLGVGRIPSVAPSRDFGPSLGGTPLDRGWVGDWLTGGLFPGSAVFLACGRASSIVLSPFVVFLRSGGFSWLGRSVVHGEMVGSLVGARLSGSAVFFGSGMSAGSSVRPGCGTGVLRVFVAGGGPGVCTDLDNEGSATPADAALGFDGALELACEPAPGLAALEPDPLLDRGGIRWIASGSGEESTSVGRSLRAFDLASNNSLCIAA